MANDPLGFIPDIVLIHGKTTDDEIIPIAVNDSGQVETDSNDKGWFLNEAAILAAYPNTIADPTVRSGWYCENGDTVTMWLWDVTGNAWADTGIACLVQSIFTRTGDVVAVSGDYTWAQINKATSSIADITTKTHALLSSLTADDHSGYLWGLGRAGSQTQIGGTAASETLTLQSTAHATKGKILFGTSAYDEVNNRLGIGESAPDYLLDVAEIGNKSGDFKIQADVQGDVTLFEDTDVGDLVDGKKLIIYRKAAEFDTECTLHIDNNGIVQMNGPAHMIYQSSSTLRFEIGAAEIMRVNSTGVGISVIPTAKFHVDQATSDAAIPVVTLDQADISEEFIRYIGSAASGVLTQSIVNDSDVNTATLVGWKKCYVVDVGNQITDQSYYEPIYTLA